MIPARLEDLTPAWLTGALRSRGHLAHGEVRAVAQQVLGEGEGFMGVISRLALTFDGDAGDLPGTLIAKLPTFVEENRVMGEMLGAYWREIHFYEELSCEMPVRVPRVYYSDLTPDKLRQRQDQIVRFLDRMPARLVNWLMNSSGKLVRRNAHRYVLLLEDLAPARVGDQVAGGSFEICAQALAAAARMHAAFWQKPVLDDKFWLSRQTSGARTRQRMYLSARGEFCARHGARWSDGDVAVFAWLDRHGEALGRALHADAPRTLLHCDFRLDNLFFDAASESDPVILADWQLAGVGAAAYDVAYLLSGTLAPDVSPAAESRLLHGYHAALLAGGVRGYAFDDIERDYRRGLLTVLQVLSTTDTVEMGDARGVTLMERWTERTLARLRHVDRDALLS